MKKFLLLFLCIIALFFLALNIYGLTQSLDLGDLTAENLRFKNNDVLISKSDFNHQLFKLDSESDKSYAERATKVIALGMAHLHWEKYAPEKFHQTVPAWENYILYAMGKWSGIPEYKRYHFVSPEKSVERGIGICGDVSMLLSQKLTENNIDNKIVTVPGHVMVEANFNGDKQLLDPDFGVVLKNGGQFYRQNPDKLEKIYNDYGFKGNGEGVVVRGISEKITYWNGAQHFITKKYYFEKVSYVAIWLLPIFFLMVVFLALRNRKKVGK
jgi:hypothetical protein